MYLAVNSESNQRHSTLVANFATTKDALTQELADSVAQEIQILQDAIVNALDNLNTRKGALEIQQQQLLVIQQLATDNNNPAPHITQQIQQIAAELQTIQAQINQLHEPDDQAVELEVTGDNQQACLELLTNTQQDTPIADIADDLAQYTVQQATSATLRNIDHALGAQAPALADLAGINPDPLDFLITTQANVLSTYPQLTNSLNEYLNELIDNIALRIRRDTLYDDVEYFDNKLPSARNL